MDAAINLEIPSVRDRILNGLTADKKNFYLATPRLLNIADRAEDDELKWECYFDLFYRVRPMSLTDALALGSSTLALITHVRESVRNDLIWDLTAVDVDRSKLCTQPGSCQHVIVQAIRLRMSTPPPNNTTCSVFDIPALSSMCATCKWARIKLANSYRINKLDQKVRNWVSTLLPSLPSASDDDE